MKQFAVLLLLGMAASFSVVNAQDNAGVCVIDRTKDFVTVLRDFLPEVRKCIDLDVASSNVIGEVDQAEALIRDLVNFLSTINDCNNLSCAFTYISTLFSKLTALTTALTDLGRDIESTLNNPQVLQCFIAERNVVTNAITNIYNCL